MRVCFFLFFYDFYLNKAQLYPLRTTDGRQSHLRYLSLCFLRFLRLLSDFKFRFFLNRQRGSHFSNKCSAFRCTPCGGRPAGVRAIVSGGRPGVRASGDRLTGTGSARRRSGRQDQPGRDQERKQFETFRKLRNISKEIRSQPRTGSDTPPGSVEQSPRNPAPDQHRNPAPAVNPGRRKGHSPGRDQRRRVEIA